MHFSGRWLQGAVCRLLKTMAAMNQNMQATILMVTNDPFSALFCKRILFLKDGRIFNEILKGGKAEMNFGFCTIFCV